MPNFKVTFSADTKKYINGVQQMQGKTQTVAQSILAHFTALAGAGAMSSLLHRFKDTGAAVISMAADMEKTKVAFEVMLGGAEKSKKVLGDLVKFADVTPFQTDEIIAAGRALIACGTDTDQLTGRLELLGNIAAGTNMRIGDMVAIYAKMANKGKAQSEELNQMAERGIPIYKLLCDMLGITQGELVKMAEKGQLSFGLIHEALARLGGEGGQYFGLIAKQSKTLDGLWSTLQGNIKLLATSLGELVIPELSANLAAVIAELERMKNSGELDQVLQQLADTIVNVLRAVKDLAVFLYDNKETIWATGKIIAYYMAAAKVSGVLLSIGKVIKAMPALKLMPGAAMSSLRGMSPAFKVLTADVGALHKAMGGLGMAMGSIGPIAATAFAGWEIGKRIAELLQLEDKFTRLMLKMQGMSDEEIEDAMSGNQGKVEAAVDAYDYAGNHKRLQELETERKKLQAAMDNLTPDGDNAKQRAAMQQRIDLLDQETSQILSAERKHEQDMLAAGQRKKEIMDQVHAMQDAQRRDRQGPRTEESQQRIDHRQAWINKLMSEYQTIVKAERAQQESLDKLHEQEAQALVASGVELSEAEKAKAARQLAAKEEAAKALKKLDKEKNDVDAGLQSIAEAQFKDRVSAQIETWRKEITGYQEDIDKAEQSLNRFGASVKGDILKSPEQIAQERQDNILKEKIAAHNQGAKVRFTSSEKKRIAQLQAEQAHARSLLARQQAREQSIDRTESAMDQVQKEQKTAEQDKDLQALQTRQAALGGSMTGVDDRRDELMARLEMVRAQPRIQAADMRGYLAGVPGTAMLGESQGHNPLESIMTRVEQILSERLPAVTM